MKNYKQFFLSALMSSFLIFSACNDSATTEDGTSTETSEMSATDDTGMGDNNTVTKSGLPLSADQEVPVNNSPATGTANVTYNKETKMLSYTVNYSGLTAAPTMAHIHGTAPKGVNAGVKHDLTPVLEKNTTGNFTDSVKVDGSGITEDSLLSGFYYFNIHTPTHPGGEIRGQIAF